MIEAVLGKELSLSSVRKTFKYSTSPLLYINFKKGKLKESQIICNAESASKSLFQVTDYTDLGQHNVLSTVAYKMIRRLTVRKPELAGCKEIRNRFFAKSKRTF